MSQVYLYVACNGLGVVKWRHRRRITAAIYNLKPSNGTSKT
jgi:hypothetical protein